MKQQPLYNQVANFMLISKIKLKKKYLFTVLIFISTALFAETNKPVIFNIESSLSSLISIDTSRIKSIAIWKISNETGENINLEQLVFNIKKAIFETKSFEIIDRGKLNLLLKEKDFGETGLVDPQKAAKLRLLGVDAFLYGRISNFKGKKILFLKIVEVNTSGILWAKEIDAEGDISVDAFIHECTSRINESIGKMPDIKSIAIWKIGIGSNDSADIENLKDRLEISLVKRKQAIIVNRQSLEMLLEEQNLSLNDEIMDAARRKKIGKLYSIDAFIFGRKSTIAGDRDVLFLKILVVETGEIITCRVVSPSLQNVEYISSIDNAAKKISNYLQTNYGSSNRTFSILKIENMTGSKKVDLKEIEDLLATHISDNRELKFLDRDVLDIILNEFRIDISGLVNAKAMSKIGKLYGIDYFLVLKIYDTSKLYKSLSDDDYFIDIVLQVINTETSILTGSKMFQGKNLKNIEKVVKPGRKIFRTKNRHKKLFEKILTSFESIEQNDSDETVAVWKLTNKGDPFAPIEYIRDGMSICFLESTKFKVVNREYLDWLLREQKLSESGLIDADKIKSIGKLYGIKNILYGDIADYKDSITANLSILNVETGKLIWIDRFLEFNDELSTLSLQDTLVKIQGKKFKKNVPIWMIPVGILGWVVLPYAVTSSDPGELSKKEEYVYASISIGGFLLSTLFVSMVIQRPRDKYNKKLRNEINQANDKIKKENRFREARWILMQKIKDFT